MEGKEFLSKKEISILNLIIQDIETGRHLLRDEKGWEMIEKTYGFSREEYSEFWKNELTPAMEGFDVFCSAMTPRHYEIVMLYKLFVDGNFASAFDHIAKIREKI